MPGIHTDYYAICNQRLTDDCEGKSGVFSGSEGATKRELQVRGWEFKLLDTYCPACAEEADV